MRVTIAIVSKGSDAHVHMVDCDVYALYCGATIGRETWSHPAGCAQRRGAQQATRQCRHWQRWCATKHPRCTFTQKISSQGSKVCLSLSDCSSASVCYRFHTSVASTQYKQQTTLVYLYTTLNTKKLLVQLVVIEIEL